MYNKNRRVKKKKRKGEREKTRKGLVAKKKAAIKN